MQFRYNLYAILMQSICNLDAIEMQSVWANLISVYGTQKPVHCTQISVYATQKILANFLQNVEFVFGTQNQNSYTFQGFRR